MQTRYALMDGVCKGARLALVLGVGGYSTEAEARPAARWGRGGGVTWVLAGCGKEEEKGVEVGVEVLLMVLGLWGVEEVETELEAVADSIGQSCGGWWWCERVGGGTRQR